MGQKPSMVQKDHTVKDEVEKYQQNSRANVLRTHLTQGQNMSNILLTDAMEHVIKSQLASPVDSDEEQDMRPGIFTPPVPASSTTRPGTSTSSATRPGTSTSSATRPGTSTSSATRSGTSISSGVNNSGTGAVNGGAQVEEPAPKKFKGPKKYFLQEYLNETQGDGQVAAPSTSANNVDVGNQRAVQQAAPVVTPSPRKAMPPEPCNNHKSMQSNQVWEAMIKTTLMDQRPGQAQTQDDFLKTGIRTELSKTVNQDRHALQQYAEKLSGETSISRSKHFAAMLAPREDEVNKHINNTIRQELYNTAPPPPPRRESPPCRESPPGGQGSKSKPLTVREHIQEAIKLELGLDSMPDQSKRGQSQSPYNSSKDRARSVTASRGIVLIFVQ